MTSIKLLTDIRHSKAQGGLIEILYYRCKHENNVLTLVVGSSFLLSPASEKGKCILWVSDFY